MLSLHLPSTLILLIDVQERFLPAIPLISPDQEVGRACRVLLEGTTLLGVPVLISEQYTKGLGPTLPHLLAAAPGATRMEKTHFSCVDDPDIALYIDRQGRRTIVVAGIEAHVCVLATVIDLRSKGFDVVVAADAVASRSASAREHALTTMRQHGAVVVPVESILFRLQRQAGVGCFKQIAALVK